jgi:predicted Zn-dependent peptidase
VLHEAPPESSPDAALERVLLAVLSGSMSGRLFTEVREKRGLCYSVHARYAGERDYGTVAADAGTTPERAAESIDVLLDELRRVHTPAGAVTPEEFRRAVTGLKSRLVISGESSNARAAALASDIHRLGRPRSLEQHAAEIDAVTLDALNAYLRRRSMGRVTVHSLGAARLAPKL